MQLSPVAYFSPVGTQPHADLCVQQAADVFPTKTKELIYSKMSMFQNAKINSMFNLLFFYSSNNTAETQILLIYSQKMPKMKFQTFYENTTPTKILHTVYLT